MLESDEWELLRRLRLAALLDAPYAFASDHRRELDRTPEQWRGWAEQSPWFIAECSPGDEPVGLVTVRRQPDEAPERRMLLSMWVSPSCRGRGLAGLLIDAARDWSVRDGASELTLWVVEGNAAAIRAYARAGFEETGRRQPLPRRPAVTETEWRVSLGRSVASFT